MRYSNVPASLSAPSILYLFIPTVLGTAVCREQNKLTVVGSGISGSGISGTAITGHPVKPVVVIVFFTPTGSSSLLPDIT